MELKIADSRGRVNLGKEFANKTFLIEKTGETEMKLELAAVIPEREMWFHKNPEAQAAVVGAIERLSAGQFAETPPDIDAEDPWMGEFED
jgi:hypothetical protein